MLLVQWTQMRKNRTNRCRVDSLSFNRFLISWYTIQKASYLIPNQTVNNLNMPRQWRRGLTEKQPVRNGKTTLERTNARTHKCVMYGGTVDQTNHTSVWSPIAMHWSLSGIIDHETNPPTIHCWLCHIPPAVSACSLCLQTPVYPAEYLHWSC